MKLSFHRLPVTVLACIVGLSVASAQRDTVTILHVNDSHSTLASVGPRGADLQGTRGGLARVASLVGMQRMVDPRTLLLHAGDAFIGDLFFNRYFGVAELRMLKAFGISAMTLGNHEFDLTTDVLSASLDSAFVGGKFPVLSANLRMADPSLQHFAENVEKWTIIQYGDVKVGIFGMTTPEANFISNPGPAFVDTSIVDIAAAMVDTLRKQGCRLVLCLSHLGISIDQAIAAYVPGIDAVIGGHDHLRLDSPVMIQNVSGGQTPVVQAGAVYTDLGRLRFEVTPTSVSLLDYALIPVTDQVPEEPTIKAIVDALTTDIESVYGPLYSAQIATATADFDEVPDFSAPDHFYDTPAGNLVTDAFRETLGTDIAICAGGSIAQPLHKGHVVAADVFRMLGYGFNMDNGLGYRMARFSITGQALMMGLEFGCSQIESSDEFFIQVSGMQYQIDPSAPPFARIVDARIGGMPLDPSAVYTVASNEFAPMLIGALGIPISDVHVYPDTTEFQVVLSAIIPRSIITPLREGRIRSTSLTSSEIVPAPAALTLEQNYPNPFHASTTMAFTIPDAGHATLRIYDALGREVATLADENLVAGRYVRVFDAIDLPSGSYAAVLTHGATRLTKNLTLAR